MVYRYATALLVAERCAGDEATVYCGENDQPILIDWVAGQAASCCLGERQASAAR